MGVSCQAAAVAWHSSLMAASTELGPHTLTPSPARISCSSVT